MPGGDDEARRHHHQARRQAGAAAAARLVAGIDRDPGHVDRHAERDQPLAAPRWPAGGRHAQQPVEPPAGAHDGRPKRRAPGVPIVEPDRQRQAGADGRGPGMARCYGGGAGGHGTAGQQALADPRGAANADRPPRQRPLGPLAPVDFDILDVVEHHARGIEAERGQHGQPAGGGGPCGTRPVGRHEEAGEHVGGRRGMVGEPHEPEPVEHRR
jgi:hypothetical protein